MFTKYWKKTILQWTVEGLKAAGCDDIFVITGHKGNEISKLDIKLLKIKIIKLIIYYIHCLKLKIYLIKN